MKIPMIGPLTTPPITIAASSIPGRYLHHVLVVELQVAKEDTFISAIRKLRISELQLRFATQPDDEGDGEGESSKEESKDLGEESREHELVSHKVER